MKKIILLAIVITGLLSCSKDDGQINTKMSALIDNVTWNSITRITVLRDGKFNIVGTSIDGKIIDISVFGNTPGTYSISASEVKFAGLYKESASASTDDIFVATSGEVVLTEVNTSAKEISGTFNMVLRRSLTGATVSISNGTFTKLKYTEGEQ